MPRPRRDDLNAATMHAIKHAARALMAEHGTAGLSMRAIARELNISAPALYHYFASLHDLITALIVDAFTSQAAAVRTARDSAAAAQGSYGTHLLAAIMAYRAWAVANPIDFQLIYGNPIPGYVAPADVTTPVAQAVGAAFMETLHAAMQAGVLVIPPFTQTIPPAVATHYQAYLDTDDPAMLHILHIMNATWSTIHGIVTLEIYNHIPHVVGDTEAFYREYFIGYLRMHGLEA